MTLLFCDGCDSYGVASDLATKWTGGSGGQLVSASLGRFGGGCIRLQGSTEGLIWKDTGSTSSTVYLQAAIRTEMLASSGNASLFRIMDTTNSNLTHVTAYMVSQNTTPYLQIYRGSASSPTGSFVLQSPTITMNTTDWFLLEARVTIHPTAGRFYVKLGNTVMFDYTGNTTNTNGLGSNRADRVAIGGGCAYTNYMRWDDVIIYDDQGTRFNTFPIPDFKIETLRPETDASVQFSRISGGTNAANLNGQAPDGDTTYVQSGTTGHTDLFGVPDLSATPTTIHAVAFNAVARKTDTAARNLVVLGKSGASEVTATAALTSAYANTQVIAVTDPATGAAWTASGVNNVQTGYRVG